MCSYAESLDGACRKSSLLESRMRRQAAFCCRIARNPNLSWRMLMLMLSADADYDVDADADASY